MLCVQLVLCTFAHVGPVEWWGETWVWRGWISQLLITGNEKENVQEGVIGARWPPSSELGSFSVSTPWYGGSWAIWCFWDASGLPVLSVSVLKLSTFQPSSSQHSSPLPSFLRLLGWEGPSRFRARSGCSWQGQGGTARPLPQSGWTGEQALASSVLQFYWAAGVSALRCTLLFSPSPTAACAGAVTSTWSNHHCTDGFAPLEDVLPRSAACDQKLRNQLFFKAEHSAVAQAVANVAHVLSGV